MSSSTLWRRVTKAEPCPICLKPDFCGVAREGSACICMRVQDGAVRPTRNGGFLHRLVNGPWTPPRHRAVALPERMPSRHDLPILARQYATAVNPARLRRFANRLGLTVGSLQRLGIGWSNDSGAWAFPMRGADGNVCGIRLRLDSGRKFSVTGGREGLFIPVDLTGTELLVTEGPTDCASLLDLGFDAVGRPSCTGGVRLLVELVNARKPSDVGLVADADEPGQRGAEALATALAPFVRRLRIVRPPDGIKDARGWKQAGATTATVRAAINAAPVRSLRIAAGPDRGQGVSQ